MRFVIKTAFLTAISLILLSANASTALASTPYLTVTTSGGGNVQVTINSADPYSRVDLSYKPQGTSLWTIVGNIGSTNQSGYFSQNVNIGYQGTQMDMFATVNGQQSATVNVGGGSCPYVGCGNGSITLSPSTLNLNIGQSQNVSIYEAIPYGGQGAGYYNNYYISNNTNSSAVSASISGTTLYVNGNNSGTANITVCSYNSGSSCGILYVTVGGSGSGQLTFSQSNVTLNSGQSSSVSIYNSGSNSFYINSNSNSSVVSATVNGSTLNFYGNNAGSSTVMICSADFIPRCGSVYVTVNGGNSQITFSQSNVNLSYGQSTSVSIYGGSGSYYVSNNSNSSVVSATVSGSTLNLYGYASGSSTLTVCSSGNSYQCGYLYVTVGGGYSGSISFNPSNPSVNVGQTTNVSVAMAIPVYGNNSPFYSQYYVSSNSNSNAVTATISGSLISLTGRAVGTSNISVCASGYSATCGTLYVTVTGGTVGSNNVSIYDSSFSPTNITVTAGSTITWRNYGVMNHTVNANNGAFNSGTIVPGGTYSLTLNTPGTYTYYCQFHPGMTGTITVSGVLGGGIYGNGTLVNDNGTIYITYKNMKSGFANYPAFTGLGYKLSNVISGSTSTMVNSGYVVSTANASHPWGSWVKSGNTIYFAHELGLIPISSYDIFLNNGGNLNAVVNANSHDLQRSILSIMVFSDPRLQ